VVYQNSLNNNSYRNSVENYILKYISKHITKYIIIVERHVIVNFYAMSQSNFFKIVLFLRHSSTSIL